MICFLLFLLPGSTSTMRLSCVRLLRSSWLNVLSIITISDDGLERCRERRGNLWALCMPQHDTPVFASIYSCVPTSASTISSRLYLLTIAWVLFSTWVATTSNSSSTVIKKKKKKRKENSGTFHLQKPRLDICRFRVKLINARLYPLRTPPGWVEFPGTRGTGGFSAVHHRLNWIDADL